MSDSVGRGLKCQDGQEALSALAEMISSDLWLLGSRQSWQFRLQTIQLRSRGHPGSQLLRRRHCTLAEQVDDRVQLLGDNVFPGAAGRTAPGLGPMGE